MGLWCPIGIGLVALMLATSAPPDATSGQAAAAQHPVAAGNCAGVVDRQ